MPRSQPGPAYLTRLYINNDPYLFDTQSQQVCAETEHGEWEAVEHFRDARKFYVASYPVLTLNGVPHFHEEERKLFRRVGAPFDFKTYHECEGVKFGTLKKPELLDLMKKQRELAFSPRKTKARRRG